MFACGECLCEGARLMPWVGNDDPVYTDVFTALAAPLH
jgi:hypothetical protein